MITALLPTKPFDFTKMLQRPLSRPSKAIVIDPLTLSYTRALRLKTRVVPITVALAIEGDELGGPTLRVTHPDELTEGERMEVIQRVQRVFSTEVNLHDFYAKMSDSPEWSVLIQQLHGLRPIQDADLFESMVKVIIGQQLNIQFAATLVERLIDLCGDTVGWNGIALPAFPSPEQVASWSYDQLRALSFSQRKAEYVIDFARTVVDGRIDMGALWNLSNEEIYEVLTPLRGIGRWTVECFLLFGMGRQDVMPAADIGVQNAMQALYGMEHRPKEEEVRELTEDFAPWRSYVTYYLWQSLIKQS